jgi:hypothetical protein
MRFFGALSILQALILGYTHVSLTFLSHYTHDQPILKTIAYVDISSEMIEDNPVKLETLG